ncbi:MAG: alcohol dehydrogenase catalytic domain-containing protein, partial [Spirochaetaceae bacterium]
MRSMKAVVTTGNGGYDKLEYKDVPIPVPDEGEVLLRVLAAGVNNTEINTRVGWYSASVKTATNAAADTQTPAEVPGDGGWNEATPFPFIQGTDCCGRVEAVGAAVDGGMVGRRVLVRPCIRRNGFGSLENIWMGSDFDGAFAQYVKVPATEVFRIESDWRDEELATIPCAYGTSENMLHRSAVGTGDRVLVAGASGGVGSATVQLVRRRGAHVVAIAGKAKMERVRAIGADEVIARDADIVSALGRDSVDVIVDNVGGASLAVGELAVCPRYGFRRPLY